MVDVDTVIIICAVVGALFLIGIVCSVYQGIRCVVCTALCPCRWALYGVKRACGFDRCCIWSDEELLLEGESAA